MTSQIEKQEESEIQAIEIPQNFIEFNQ